MRFGAGNFGFLILDFWGGYRGHMQLLIDMSWGAAIIVNAILKPKSGRLEDMFMMRIASVFSKLKRPLAGAVLLLLAGCAGGQAADVKDGAVADDVAAVKNTASVDSFTTVGKPTKTIETPWGAREVYDPAQDEEVRNIFQKYNQNADTSSESDRHNFLRHVVALTADAYRDIGCTVVLDGLCRYHKFPGCEGPGAPLNCVSLPPVTASGGTCDFPDHRHGVREFQSMMNPDEAALKYFEIECIQWKQ